jgi:hypothetical protein
MKPNRKRLKVTLAARHARSIKRGIEALYSVDQILDAWFALQDPIDSQIQNAPTHIATQMARDWVKVQAHRVDTERLNFALARLYADGWILGQDLGYYEIAKTVRINKAAPSRVQLSNSLKMNWRTWRAGNRAAAALVEPPNGLKRLLAGRGIKINDLSTTTLNRIGTALADGLRVGATRASIADDISYILGDDARALAIAGTEMSAAVVQSNLELYAESGVEQVEYLVADPCDECAENEEASPLPLGEEFPNGNPPVHPNCMCDIAPYVVDTGLWAWLEEEE